MFIWIKFETLGRSINIRKKTKKNIVINFILYYTIGLVLMYFEIFNTKIVLIVGIMWLVKLKLLLIKKRNIYSISIC